MKHTDFKVEMEVNVDACYLNDEASPKSATATAIVKTEPSDNEELVMVQYEGGDLDYVPQDILTPHGIE